MYAGMGVWVCGRIGHLTSAGSVEPNALLHPLRITLYGLGARIGFRAILHIT